MLSKTEEMFVEHDTFESSVDSEGAGARAAIFELNWAREGSGDGWMGD